MRRLLATLALTSALVGCGDDDGPSGSASIAGNYVLQSIDGDPVPSTIIQLPDYLLEVTQGSLTVNANNTWSASVTFREDDDGTITVETDTDGGTYTRTNNSVSFTSTQGGVDAAGSISGSTLTVTDEDGFVYIFRR